MDWSQPEISVKVSSKKSDEKSRKLLDESDETGLDWSRPLADPIVKDDDELELEWSDDPDTEEEDLPVAGSGLKKTGSFKKTIGKSNSKTTEGNCFVEQITFTICIVWKSDYSKMSLNLTLRFRRRGLSRCRW